MQDSSIPLGFCQCGCGEKTVLAPRTNTANGYVKGKPIRYVHGHNGRKPSIAYLLRESPNRVLAVPLNHGKIALIDEGDWEKVRGRSWHVEARGSHRWYAYNQAELHGRRKWTYMHSLILEATPGLQIDHIDGDGLNNQRSNLRLVTHQQNGANASLNCANTSGFKGVFWHKHKKRWCAQVFCGGKHIYRELFHDKIQAAKAYDAAARAVFGEFARVNFPD